MSPYNKQQLARLQGMNDGLHRFARKFRLASDGTYERLESLMRGWVAVEDPTEAIAYLAGYEEGRRG